MIARGREFQHVAGRQEAFEDFCRSLNQNAHPFAILSHAIDAEGPVIPATASGRISESGIGGGNPNLGNNIVDKISLRRVTLRRCVFAYLRTPVGRRCYRSLT